ncbi:MAG: helix-turn-helix domain-containing protein [Terriglobia bacterium]
MAGFGENLRREREMRGITLEEISNTTRVSVRLLEALENEDFSRLPGGIFTRSFIRAYANYIGLDEEHVMSEYQMAAPPRAEEDLSRFGANNNKTPKKLSAPILPWAIAVLLLAGGYGMFRYRGRSAEVPAAFGNSSPAPSASAAAPIPVAPSSGPPPQILMPNAQTGQSTANPASSGAPVAAAGSQNSSASTSPLASGGYNQTSASQVSTMAAGTGKVVDAKSSSNVALPTSPPQPTAPSAASVAAAEAAGKLVLQVAATQRAWVAVDADGKTVLERVLGPAEQRTLMAKNYFDVTTGNAQGTVLTLNGVTLKPAGGYGEVKTLHLTREDLRNSTR